MYRPPRAAADTSSRRSRPLPPAPVLRPDAFEPAALPRTAPLAPSPLLRPGALAPAPLLRSGDPALAPQPHPALFVPAPLISTPSEEAGFAMSASSMDGRMHDDLLSDDQFPEEEACNGLMQSGYFTGLLVNDGEASQTNAHPSDPIINEASVANKCSQGRKKNFSTQEDILLVSAWLNVSLDPIQGVEQSQGTYWARIYDYFHANKQFDSARTEVSLINRWSTIQHDVNTFCGCLTRIQSLNQSGSRIDDKIANACAMYKAEDKLKRKFNLMHCWNVLKDKPKWIERWKDIGSAQKSSNKKQKTAATSIPTSVEHAAPDGGGSDGQPSGRPDGRKKEKQKLKQGRTKEAVEYLMAIKKEGDLEKELKKDERCKKAFDLQEERNQLEREKFEFQKRQAEKEEEERILGLDLTTMNYKQQQYYEERQNEILARYCNI